ncbi:MAG TPA: hypothetical protein VIM12_03155 [Noviherbaspirillum sp.]|jgi:hypothetical protein|uniref:hypothetical protein n=1 Tax=Noviherbaspirillum sp. TaxID=1926288 RepID=UPI002F9419E8
MGRNYIAERTIADPRERAAEKARRKQLKAKQVATDLAIVERLNRKYGPGGESDLFQQQEPQPKRGRGRPRKDDAMTPAERAKRYRERRRQMANNGDVTQNNQTRDVTNNEDVDFWRGMYDAQLERTVELERRLNAGGGKRWTYAQVTEITEKRISELMAEAGSNVDSGDYHAASQKRNWAFGCYLAWSELTGYDRPVEDRKRLEGICNAW